MRPLGWPSFNLTSVLIKENWGTQRHQGKCKYKRKTVKTQQEGAHLHVKERGLRRNRFPARSPMWDSVLGCQDHAVSQKADAQPVGYPGVP